MRKISQTNTFRQKLRALILLVGFTLFPFTADGKSKNLQPSSQTKDVPIMVESDMLTVNQNDNSGVFTGDVRATHGDMVLTADTMVVYYTKQENAVSPNIKAEDSTGAPEHSKIEKIIARKNVTITTSSEKATGDEGEYIMKTQTFTLLGDVKIIQGANVLTGGKFTYNRLTGKGTLYSGSKDGVKGRARGLIVPEGKK